MTHKSRSWPPACIVKRGEEEASRAASRAAVAVGDQGLPQPGSRREAQGEEEAPPKDWTVSRRIPEDFSTCSLNIVMIPCLTFERRRGGAEARKEEEESLPATCHQQ